MKKWCRCFALRDIVKLIALLNIIASATAIVLCLIPINGIGGQLADTNIKIRLDKEGKYVTVVLKLVILLAFLVYSLGNLLLSSNLLHGAIKDKISKCTLWLYFNLVAWIILLVLIVGFVAYISIGSKEELEVWQYVIGVLLFALQAYFLYVVREYIGEVRKYKPPGSSVYTGRTG